MYIYMFVRNILYQNEKKRNKRNAKKNFENKNSNV